MARIEVDRRTLLTGGAVAGGLVIAFALWPRRPGSPLRAARPGERVFGPYLRIAGDGRVTVAVPQAETGQGIWTALAAVAAAELGADWKMVGVEPAPIDASYVNSIAKEEWGVATRLTAGSSSMRAFEGPLRQAGATARALLCEAAAARWKVATGECDTADGAVVHGDRKLGFGALVEEAARIGRPVSAPLRARAVAEVRPRVDLAAKASGSWRFAGDVRLPDMQFASLRMAPPGGRVIRFDRAAAAEAGIRLVERRGWLAAIGPSWWAAEQALKRAAPSFTGPANADTPGIEAALDRALADGNFKHLVDRGDYDAAVAGHRPLSATYFAAPTPHLSLEPVAAAARISGGRAELWIASQAPDLAHAAIAKASGIAALTLYPMSPGDSGGGAVENLAGPIAIELAKVAGRPVSLTIPATTSQNHDRPRPPLLAKMSALGDADSGLASWHAMFAGAAGLAASLARAAGLSVPGFEARGGVPPYAIPALRVSAANGRIPIATGYLRGDIEALTSFATESFIDEMARAYGAEPLAFRISHLGGAPRLAKALLTATARGGWDGGGRGSAMGIACASAWGSHIGLLAEASLTGDQRVRVTRMVAAVDCGRAVHPDLVRQQVEGGLIHALIGATGPAPEIVAGEIRARSLRSLGLARLDEVPRIEVVIMPSEEAPGGVSGLGALVAPAAAANAIFAATGRRLRRLPLDPNDQP